MIFEKNLKKIQFEKQFHNDINGILSRRKDIEKLESDIKKGDYANFIESLSKLYEAIPSEKLKNLKEIIALSKDLAHYESFRGRIDFSHYLSLFDFENYIYRDKKLSSNNFKQKNIEVVADFASSVLTKYIYDDFISKDIRKHIEGYFLAIMSNIDYKLYTHELFTSHEHITTPYSVSLIMGSVPEHFRNISKDIIDERVNFTKNIVQSNEIVFLSGKTEDIKHYETEIDEPKIVTTTFGDSEKNQLTKKCIHAFFDQLKYHTEITKKMNSNSWELRIYTSSFNVIKCALELDQYIHNFEPTANSHISDCFAKLVSVKIIPECRIFDLITNPPVGKDEIKHRKQKLKAMLFELYSHALNKNLHIQ